GLGAGLRDDEAVDRRTAGTVAGADNQRAIGGQLTLATAYGLFDQLGSADVGVNGGVGLRHLGPRRPAAESSERCVVSHVTHYIDKKVAGVCQKSEVLGSLLSMNAFDRARLWASVTGRRRRLAVAGGEQLGDVAGVEQIALVAELAVDFHLAAAFLQQGLGIRLADADQGPRRALARAAAAELQ